MLLYDSRMTVVIKRCCVVVMACAFLLFLLNPLVSFPFSPFSLSLGTSIRVEVDMNLDLVDEGVWTDAPDAQGQIMRIRLFSKGAKSITLQFSTFYMPKGADVFVYNGYTSEYLSVEDVGRTETDLTMVSSEHPGSLQKSGTVLL